MTAIKRKIILNVGIIAVIIGVSFYLKHIAFSFGLLISLGNWALHNGCFLIYNRRNPNLRANEIVRILVRTTVIRFVSIGLLLLIGFTYCDPEPLILGFVLGQIFYLFHQSTMVAINNVK